MATPIRLSLLDTAMLRMDSPEAPMHIGGACIFRLPADAGPDYVRRLYDRWRRTKVERSPFNYRLADHSVPSLRPAWEVATRVDLAEHLFHTALPTPGGRMEMAELMGRLYTAPFDRSRPLWEVYLIEGLASRRFALYTKVHHALMDGVTAQRTLTVALSENPASRDKPPPWVGSTPSRPPRSASRSGEGDRDRRPAATGTSTLLTAQRLLRAIAQLPAAAAGLQSLGRTDVPAPDTVLNRPITGSRFADSVVLKLARMRAAGSRLGATVNDVGLAVCGGALRRYLRETGQLPAESLRALVPIALPGEGDGQAGNRASAITVPLGTNLDDPLRRLSLIIGATRAAKAAVRNATPQLVTALHSPLLMAPAALEKLTGVRLLGRSSFNLAISNVPGPPRKLYLYGAEMEQIVPNFLLGPGMALSILLTSYHDRVGITVSACPDALPGIERIIPMLETSFEELYAAQRKAPRGSAGRRRSGERR